MYMAKTEYYFVKSWGHAAKLDTLHFWTVPWPGHLVKSSVVAWTLWSKIRGCSKCHATTPWTWTNDYGFKICFPILYSNQRPNNLVSDYELRLRQKRHCSLPERSYNPRQAPNEFYKFRSFSIKPNGCLINHGDVIAKRRASKSSSCSTANTSRYSSDFLRKPKTFDEISQHPVVFGGIFSRSVIFKKC